MGARVYCVQAARSARLVALSPTTGGRWDRAALPPVCPSNEVTVLPYAGVGLFAEVPSIDGEWPKVTNSVNGVVVVGMGALPDVSSSKVVPALANWAKALHANGGRLIIADLSPAPYRCCGALASPTRWVLTV